MREVSLDEAVKALESDETYRLSVYFGKNGKYSVDRGQMYGNIRQTLMDIMTRYPNDSLMMD